MTNQKITGGTVHKLTNDIKTALTSDFKAHEAWEKLTPLARNEWICWVTFVKQATTREEHVRRMVSELKEGKKRPCCWLGCIHRTDKELSPSVKWVLSKKKK